MTRAKYSSTNPSQARRRRQSSRPDDRPVTEISTPEIERIGLRVERGRLVEHASGALLLAMIMGAISATNYERLDADLRLAAELAGRTRH
jgi:hypothetical protein